MTQVKICRFCLEIHEENSVEVIEERKKKELEFLLLKMNLNITKEPVMCNDCVNKLKTSFSFKSTCLYTEGLIVPYVINSEKLDLKEIYLKECVDKQIKHISACENVCRLCLKVYKKECFHTLQHVKEHECLFNILEKYLPELNLESTSEVLICEACFHFLQYYYEFVFICLGTETKVKLYCQNEKLNSNQQVNLDRLKELQINEVDIKGCNSSEGYTENTDTLTSNSSLENVKQIENMEIEIKDENQFEHEEDSTSQYNNEVMENEIGQKSSKPEPSDIRLTKPSWNHLHPSEETSFVKKHRKHGDPSSFKLYKCKDCTFQTNTNQSLKMHVLAFHSDTETTHFFHCYNCSYKSKRKDALASHVLIHMDKKRLTTFKCEFCPYDAKYKRALQKHMEIHKDASIKKKFKCNSCTYEANYEHNLTLHKLIHHNTSKIIHKCNLCSYKTKIPDYLKRHAKRHKDKGW